MAKVTVDARTVEESLVRVLENVAAAIDWVKPKHGLIKLDVPEPYVHLIGPASRGIGCLGTAHPDKCADVGVLFGIFDKKIKRSKARGKATSRK